MSRALQPPFADAIGRHSSAGAAKARNPSRTITTVYAVLAVLYLGLGVFGLVAKHRTATMDVALGVMWASFSALRAFAPKLFVARNTIGRRALRAPFASVSKSRD